MKAHEDWMRLALELARAATGQTSPNPMVGAVVVKNGKMVGAGAHLKAGTPHAEVHAIDMAGHEAEGSTIYVTLEPCNHIGRTPPCTEKIIASGIRRVVIGTVDPDEKVRGRGIARLRDAGIEVIEGVLAEECQRLNEAYFFHRRTGRPFVTLKTAMTLDGKIATVTGDSRWITGEASREHVHLMRHQHDAILVGIQTVLFDDPKLTARLIPGGNHPVRVILDSRLQTPLDAAITEVSEAPTWIFTTEERDRERERRLRDKGVRIVSTGTASRVDLEKVLEVLGKEGILSLLIEGGGTVNAAFLQQGLVQKVIAFIAPRLLGGKDSPTPVEGENPHRMQSSLSLKDVRVTQFDQDICVTGYLDA
ncbi:bifunctional diaminohydroxyphosphoribosylaminopyrimidine deaminase/5-amino-6-(5-phosphoribosylamino)uracil reductase RibD [Laceyella putida]|uniref:Riboflavin biosynthesis protein RibD n=1 Tax=Laceyella putida TaxID=110101 RepID=A0ABW2RMB2_9BACL